ncbi:MAG TPA: hypothetical protein VGB77_18475 [Abditibacteriaceae bacterium]
MAVTHRFRVSGVYSRVLFCLSWLIAQPLAAQDSLNPKTQTPKPNLTFRNGKKFFAQNGKTIPLLWAFGLEQTTQLDEYKASGFNTLVITLEWQSAPDETVALAPGDLKTPRALAEAAAGRGLFIIYQLPAAPTGQEHALKISGDEGIYSQAWGSWVAGAIAELESTPNLLGWMLPDDPRGLPLFDNAGFARWLASNYANIEVLNNQWGQKYASFSPVTLEVAASLGAEWQEKSKEESEPVTSLTGLPLPDANLSMAERGWAFHPAALALALYKWDAYQNLLEFWTKTLRASQPETTLFSGRLPDYAQLLSLPPELDVSLPDLPPGVAETDIVTHNPHGTSIARRGGRFAAIPILATGGTPALPSANLPILTASWLDAALAHGASGLAFSSWPELQRNNPLRATVAANLARLQMAPFSALWDQAPHAGAAVVLTPLAEGQSVQKESGGASSLYETPGQAAPENDFKDSNGRGLYGFGDDLVQSEPSSLVYALRWGTAFGAVDYLSPDDLADSGDLNTYNTLLLPQALSLSEKASSRLGEFIAKGGIVVADLGLGAAQAGGKVTEVSPSLAALFGLSPSLQLRHDRANLQLIQAHPLLPSWSNLQPGAWLTGGLGGGPAFRGPIAGGAPRGETVSLAATRLPRASSDAEDFDKIAFLTFKPLGGGGGIFAPLHLWQNWLPGAAGFDGFHGDLLSRGALIVQSGATSFVPSAAPDGIPGYPETINFANAVALLNHAPPGAPAAPSPEGLPNALPDLAAQAAQAMRDWSQVQTGAPGEWLWSNVVSAFSPAGASPAPGTPRTAPIEDKTIGNDRAQLVALHAYTPPGALLISQMAPIRVRHLTGGALMAHLMDWQEKKASFALWPNATAFTPQPDNFHITPGPSAGVNAVLYDSPDGYRIRPNSRHQVTITTLALPADASPPIVVPLIDPKTRKPKKAPPMPPPPTIPPPATKEVVADAQGRLTLEATGAALMFEVVPL